MNFFRITNSKTTRDFCPLDNAWVNDGRESTMFKNREAAAQYFDEASEGWGDGIVQIEEIQFEIEE